LSNRINSFLRLYGMPLGLLALLLLLQAIFNTVPLFTPLNIKYILLGTVSVAVTALALSYIMISGEGDLSFAGMFSLLTVVFALAANITNMFSTAFVVVSLLSVSVYFFIVWLVVKLKFSSFIVSIAIMFMANGVEKALHQQTTLVQNPTIAAFSTVEYGIPLVVWIAAIVYIASFIIINRTRFGFSLRIVGENQNAAIEAGINTGRIKFMAYLIAGLLIALAAAVESTRVGAIYEQGKFYMLPVFAACFLGSSMFVPGRVNVFGTLVGALFLGVIEKFMNMINVESYIVSIAQGVILIVAVGLVAFRQRDKIVQIKL
jgi:ribose transport system permease protein